MWRDDAKYEAQRNGAAPAALSSSLFRLFILFNNISDGMSVFFGRDELMCARMSRAVERRREINMRRGSSRRHR